MLGCLGAADTAVMDGKDRSANLGPYWDDGYSEGRGGFLGALDRREGPNRDRGDSEGWRDFSGTPSRGGGP